MKKLNLICVSLALSGAINMAHAGIAGSAHDWANSANPWNVNKDLCGPCHMAHGADPEAQLVPLWSREVPTATWTPFVSPHGTTIQSPTPDDSSLACLSCHDGTVAYNQLKGQTIGPDRFVLGDYVIGNGAARDLRGDHPVSFDYNAAVNNPLTPTNTLKLATTVLGVGADNPLPSDHNFNGQTVQAAFLKNGGAGTSTMQCASCHDVHRSIGDSALNSDMATFTSPNHNPLLVVFNGNGRIGADGYGSSLCRSCHNK